MTHPKHLNDVARRVVWFKSPAETLEDSNFFICYVMTYGTIEDIKIVRRYYTNSDFLTALKHAQPGIFDPRSWAYWNTKFKQFPIPPMPKRHIP